jgi:thiol-disulfide isomerase/thioredoxin
MKSLVIIFSCFANLLFNSSSPKEVKATIAPLKAQGISYIIKVDSGQKTKQVIHNFIFPDDKGQKLPLLDSTKKVNMVVFWASWCSPCRMEIPNLKEIYASIDPAIVRLISISVDKDKAAWLKAVKEEQMPWPQLLAEGENVKGIKEDFGFTGIPQIYFLDSKGKILAGYTGYHYDKGAGLAALLKQFNDK